MWSVKGSSDTCSITYIESEPQATLTCFFNEDIAKARKKFTVYKHSGNVKHSKTFFNQ